jgi:hypothetical protein
MQNNNMHVPITLSPIIFADPVQNDQELITEKQKQKKKKEKPNLFPTKLKYPLYQNPFLLQALTLQ